MFYCFECNNTGMRRERLLFTFTPKPRAFEKLEPCDCIYGQAKENSKCPPKDRDSSPG